MLSVTLCPPRAGRAPDAYHAGLHFPAATVAKSELLVRGISGIGFDGNSTLCGAGGSPFWEDPDNWGYPPIGIYFAEEDSGHGLFALDYRNLPADDEPPVVNIYHDSMTITRIAAHFAEFVRRLSGDDDN